MASSHSQEERCRFFAHLDLLDQEEDSETESPSEEDPQPSPKRLKANSSGFARPSTVQSSQKELVSRKQYPQHPYAHSSAANKTTTKISTKPTKRIISKAPTNLRNISKGNQIFDGLVFFFIPNSDVLKPRNLRIQSAVAHGALWSRNIDDTVTHVIVDEKIDLTSVAKSFPNGHIPSTIAVVREKWLTDCLRNKDLRDPHESRFRLRGSQATVSSVKTQEHPRLTSIARPSDKQQCAAKDELDEVLRELENDGSLPIDPKIDIDMFSSMDDPTDVIPSSDEAVQIPKENRGFQCMEKNDGYEMVDNPNSRTIEILQQMVTYYDRISDNWRTLAYRRAISALRKTTIHIRTRSEALAISGIGSRLADKIEEIVTTNRLRRLESTCTDPDDQILKLFIGIYGAGYVQARSWINRGYSTLEDLKKYANLSSNHRIGIKHYDDFQQRVPRQEVEQHASIVQRALRSVDPKLQAIVGGSYRRGESDSGDIDIIITKENASMHDIRTLMMDLAIPKLESSGFLKHAFAASSSRDDGSKWHGASALPGRNSIWRRIDLLFVPWDEFGAALIYFTGNDIFNRSIRLLASRKGMRLNQHGLFKDVMRGKGRARVTDGTLVEGRSEKKIFEHLNVPWRPPEERRC